MDIEIKTQDQRFNYCARGIIMHADKVLIMRVNDADYYHLPGGHVEFGETSEQAVLRETAEETGLTVAVKKLVAIQEQFYHSKGIINHSLLFYYLLQSQMPIKLENTVRMENDHGYVMKNELRWVSINELENIDLRPLSIKHLILHRKFDNIRHMVD